HRLCLLPIFVSFAAAATLATRHLGWRRLGTAAGATALALAFPGLIGSTSAVRLAVAPPGTVYRSLVLEARRLRDRDGDGHSAWLGGGDCDDGDARAYPLSFAGRDCLGWVPAAA